jgi:hypothetical protein
MTARDAWLPRLREIFGGRTVIWATNPVGDYDGRERTLEVFNADPSDQRPLLHQFRDVRSEVEAVVGGPVIVMFHTTKETRRLYAKIVACDLEARAK